jgi:signal transduction histidine kinase
VENGTAEALDELSDLSAGVIYYAAREAVRNAARHGRDPDSEPPFVLTISVRHPDKKDHLLSSGEKELHIVIEDNGQGLSGRENSSENGGQGLALHSTMMAVIGGTLSISSAAGEYTRVTLASPDQP